MADRFYKDIEIPDLPLSTDLPAPEVGFVQIYGKDGKLAYKNSANQEVILASSGSGNTQTTNLLVDGGNASTVFNNYVLRFDFGISGASINPTGNTNL